MDYDIEWLLEEIYLRKKAASTTDLKFLSDWNCYTHTDNEFASLVSNVFDRAKFDTYSYSYAYDQFGCKAEFIQLLSKISSLTEENVTFTPSATMSIGLSIQAVERLGLKRVLVLMPAYFSLISSLKSSSLQIIYYHLTADNGFVIDPLHLAKVISEQFIDCLIITDPIYSTGIEISLSSYNDIVSLCERNNCCLIVDYSLGGLDWNTDGFEILPLKKMEIVSKSTSYCFIDSLPKRLFINGVKGSTIFGSVAFVDIIDRIAEGIYGAMNTVQMHLLQKLLSPTSRYSILARMQNAVKKITDNYNLLTAAIDKNYKLLPTTCGTFTYMLSNTTKLHEINTKSLALHLLNENGIIVLTNDRLGFISSNALGIRINLSNESDLLVSSVLECSRLSLNSFNNRK